MAIYGKAGPAVFQQWATLERPSDGGSGTWQKVRYYTVSLADAKEAVKKKMRGFKKDGPEIIAGVEEDLFGFLQKYGGVMKFDGELPAPPDTG